MIKSLIRFSCEGKFYQIATWDIDNVAHAHDGASCNLTRHVASIPDLQIIHLKTPQNKLIRYPQTLIIK